MVQYVVDSLQVQAVLRLEFLGKPEHRIAPLFSNVVFSDNTKKPFTSNSLVLKPYVQSLQETQSKPNNSESSTANLVSFPKDPLSSAPISTSQEWESQINSKTFETGDFTTVGSSFEDCLCCSSV